MRRLDPTLIAAWAACIAFIVIVFPADANPNGCRQLYAHNTGANGLGNGWYDLDTRIQMPTSTAAGFNTTTSSTASGTKIQMWTTTGAGSSTVAFITPPFPTSYTIGAASSTVCSFYGKELATGNNAGACCDLASATCSTGADITKVINCRTAPNTLCSAEFTASFSVKTYTTTTTAALTINAGECLKVTPYICNVGTMGGAGNVSSTIDSATNANTFFVTLPTGVCLPIPDWQNWGQFGGMWGRIKLAVTRWLA